MLWFFLLEILCLVFVVTLVLNIYVSLKNIPWYVYGASWLGWFMSFAIVILVPLDILASEYNRCSQTSDTCTQPLAYLPFNARISLWRVLYWSSFILTWFVYPFLRAYSTAGHFKRVDKVREAVQQHLVTLTIALVVGLFALFYLVAVKRVDGNAIIGMAMAAANAWGMFMLVVLLGLGLVDIPRSMWRKANRFLMLKYVKYQLTSLQHGKTEAREYLTSTLKQVKKAADQMGSHNPMRGYLDIIIKECPTAEYNEIRQQSDKTADVSYGKLVKLHVQIKQAKHNLRHAEAMYSEMLKTAFDLEDIIVSTKNNRERFITWSFQAPRMYKFANWINYFEWIWYSYLDTIALTLMCFTCALLSCIIVWEEVTLAFTGTNLSIFSLLLNDLRLHNILSQAVVFVPLAYAALAAYSTLFKIRLFNYYRLIPHQETDANSIMFSAAYLCRLCAPLSYNFMTFLHLPEKSSFETIMGSMDILPFLGEHFYLYFPILIILVCLSSMLNLTTRILKVLRIKRFQFDENFNDSAIEEGSQILHDERVRGVTAMQTRTKSEEPKEFLSLSVPLKVSVATPPKISKYGNSSRFRDEEEGEENNDSNANEDHEIRVDLIPPDTKESANGFPTMNRIFGKGRV